MPKRYTPEMRDLLYKALAFRDGEKCRRCGRKPTAAKPPLVIDHIDGDEKHRAFNNLRLLCASCNAKEGYAHRRRVSTGGKNISTVTKKHLRGSEGVGGGVSLQPGDKTRPGTLKDRLGYSSDEASPEMRANNHYEGPYRAWARYQVDDRERVPREDLINGGAEFVGCSTQSATRYLKKLTSPEGPLRLEQDPKLGVVVVARVTRGESPVVRGREERAGGGLVPLAQSFHGRNTGGRAPVAAGTNSHKES